MATLAELIVRVGADVSDFNRKIAGVERKLERSLGSGAMDLSRGLVMGLAGVTAGLGALGVAGVKMAADMEQSEIAFTTMLGSADKAKSFLADLSAFAAKTPFELPGLISSSRPFTSKICGVQNSDGSWTGHHCITSRTFCTAASRHSRYGFAPPRKGRARSPIASRAIRRWRPCTTPGFRGATRPGSSGARWMAPEASSPSTWPARAR